MQEIATYLYGISIWVEGYETPSINETTSFLTIAQSKHPDI